MNKLELLLNKCRKAGYQIDIWSTDNGWSIQVVNELGGHCAAAETLSETITLVCAEALEHEQTS